MLLLQSTQDFQKGLAFRDAYKIIGRMVAYCIAEGKTLETLTLDEYRALSPVFDEDIYPAIDMAACVAGRKVHGGPAEESVRMQLGKVREFLK